MNICGDVHGLDAQITGERVFGGGSPRLFGDVWLSVYPRLISSPTTKRNSMNR